MLNTQNLGIVIINQLNLRVSADINARSVVNVPADTLLIVNQYDDVWYATTYGVRTCFVMKQYIKLFDMNNAVELVGQVIGGRLNMRSKPDAASKCIIQLPKNTIINIINFDTSSQWYIIQYKGYVGYALKTYIAIIPPVVNWSYGQTMVDELNIRRGPSRSAVRWNNVWPENRITLVKSANENWFETLYRGEQAFVSAEFITLLDCKVPSDIVQRMLYMVEPEIGRVNSVYFNGYTGQWCHRFADWLAMHAGTPKNLIPNTSNCGKGIVWFVNDTESGGFYFKNEEHKARMIGNYSAIRHLLKELTEEEAAYIPAPGDYIYFRWRNAAKDVNVSHVGIVSGVSEDKVTTVEGNAGGAVANRSYALNDDRIVGYGKPRYDAAV